MRTAAVALLVGATTAFAAPVPKSVVVPSADAPAGTTPPRLVSLQPDQTGEVRITAMTQCTVERLGRLPGDPPPDHPSRRGWTKRFQEEVDLDRVAGLRVYDTAGKEVPKADAVKALAGGGVVIVSGDGKLVSPAFLADYRKDLLVLVARDLVLEPDHYIEFYYVP